MDIQLLEIGMKVKNGVVVAVRWCFRSVYSHPFLVGLLCFMIFLHRSFPFVFSFLVSAFPVLVCTAMLLGALLSFGQPNIPEIEAETEGKRSQEAVLVKGGDAVVVEENEGCFVEGFRADEAHLSDRMDLLAGGLVGEDVFDVTCPLIGKRPLEVGLDDGGTQVADRGLPSEESAGVGSDDGGIQEAKRGLGGLRDDKRVEWGEESDGEVVENRYTPIPVADDDEHLDLDGDGKSEVDSFGSEEVNVDSPDSTPRSPWARVVTREEEGDDDVDSGSDRAESSSPDASMADIMPMLDELHPLLDGEAAPRPNHVPCDGVDAVASERSPKSSVSSHDSDGNDESHEVAGDDDDAQGDKEEDKKLAITWTEEDQKNLMDLGSSEIERNLRLETLILKRRAKKNVSMFPERDLIDLESLDFPFGIAPISTRRQNPFHHSQDNSALPPIPGSAPSVLVPRRNPFDIPYDSSEEKPNLLGDAFQEEFTASQSRDPFYRRHETFGARPSLFAGNRKVGEDVKMRPFFVPERTFSEESSYSQFQRQLSELSDSKVSSIPETESVGSVEDLEERKFSEDNDQQKVEEILPMKEGKEEGPSGDSELIPQKEEGTEEDLNQELELTSIPESPEIGDRSLEDDDSLQSSQVDKTDFQAGELKFQLDDVTYHYEQGSVTRAVEVHVTEYGPTLEDVGQRCGSSSSSSSLSEESERIFTEMDIGILPLEEERTDDFAEELGISTQASVESGELSATTAVVHDVPQREPIYDSSPREVRASLPFSSFSSDVHPELDPGFSPVLVKRTVSFMENEYPHPESLIDYPIDESRPADVNTRVHDKMDTHSLGIDQTSDGEGLSAAPGITSHAPIPLEPFIEASLMEDPKEQDRWSEVRSSNADENVHSYVYLPEDKNPGQAQEDKHLHISEADGVTEVGEPPSGDEMNAGHPAESLVTVQSQISNADVSCKPEGTLISIPAEGNTPIFHDKSMQEPVSQHPDEVPETSISDKLAEDDPTTEESNIPEIAEVGRDVPSSDNSLLSPEFIGFETASSRASQTVVEEVDEIKEIDDVLLSELDRVGDFSIDHWGSGLSEFEKHRNPMTHHSETSTRRVVEDKTEDSRIPQEDSYTRDASIEHIPEVQTLVLSEGKCIDISNLENLLDQEAYKARPLSAENEAEVVAAPSMVEDNISSMLEVEGQSTEDSHSAPKEAAALYSVEDKVSGIPKVEVESIEDVNSILEEAELTSVETNIVSGGAEVSCQGQVDIGEMPELELEASLIEGIEAAFEKVTVKETENPVLEQSLAVMPEFEVSTIEDIAPALKKVIVEETEKAVSEHHLAVMPELEASTIEDIETAFKEVIVGETKRPVSEKSLPELVVEETTSEHCEFGTLHTDMGAMNHTRDASVLDVETNDPTLDDKQLIDSTKEKLELQTPMVSEGTGLPPQPMWDGNNEKQLKPNSSDGLVKPEEDNLGSGSSMEILSTREASSITAEEPGTKVQAPNELDPTPSVKEKGKISRRSSSSSSSSSESSSSDSDKE